MYDLNATTSVRQARYRKLKDYWKAVEGGRVQKISLHAGRNCPNRDGSLGTGGCLYCSNEAFTPAYCRADMSLEQQIREGLAFQRRRYPRAVGFLGYLQAYTNTYGNTDVLKEIYRTVLAEPRLCGMVIGTRPDCLPDPLLDWLAEAAARHGKHLYFEIGVESFSDAVLRTMNRGHTFAQSEEALARLAERGIRAGAHFLVGFPGENWRAFFEQVDRLNALPLHSVKVHQLQIYRDTPLAEWWRRRPEDFSFPDKEAYFAAAARWLQRLRPDLYVDRLFGDAPTRFTVRSGWNERLDAIVAQFDAYLETHDIRQGCKR